jgi:hypothetical protein
LDRWVTECAEALGGGRYRICATQAELARREGVSPGTVQERIRRLEAAGVVVSRNPLVVDLGEAAPDRVADDGNVRCREAITALVRFMEIHGVTPALKDAVAEVVAALEPRPAADEEPREGPRLWGVPAADPRDLSLDGGDSIQSPLLLAVPSASDPRLAARRAADREGTGGSEERAGWDRAAEDLADACRVRGLPDRPHSPDALWRVAAAVSASERTAAIGRVSAQVRAGDPVKDPFGLLYRVMENRLAEYLELDARATPAAGESGREGESGAGAWARNIACVAGITPPQLREYIEGRYPHGPLRAAALEAAGLEP